MYHSGVQKEALHFLIDLQPQLALCGEVKEIFLQPFHKREGKIVSLIFVGGLFLVSVWFGVFNDN